MNSKISNDNELVNELYVIKDTCSGVDLSADEYGCSNKIELMFDRILILRRC